MNESEKTAVPAGSAAEELPFEAALEKLEALVREMENGKLPLEALIAKFEEGSRLTALCRERLDKMSRRIEILVNQRGNAPENAEWSAFDPESGRRV